MNLRNGQKLRWEQVSERECRVIIEDAAEPNLGEALGFGPRFRGESRGRSTANWMKELRAGE